MTSLLVFAIALGLAWVGTPAVRGLAWRAGVTDQPSVRKVHTRPTPLLGGLAIWAAVLAALGAVSDRGALVQLGGILAGGTLASALGIWDDRRPLRPRVKLAGQVLCAAILIVSGVSVQLADGPALWRGVGVADAALTVLWVLVLMNAVNFMDNMDGVLGGVAAAASGAFVLLAVLNDQQLVAPLAAAILGASLGFLIYNFNPATIFMGDGGSLFLGFLLAAIGIKLRFPGQPTHVSWMVPGLVVAVPLFDLALVVVSRLRRGVNPFTTGGKDHLSHRLVGLGATTREAALTIWLLACSAGGVAIFVSRAERATAWIVLAGVLALAAWGIWRLELRGTAARGGGSGGGGG